VRAHPNSIYSPRRSLLTLRGQFVSHRLHAWFIFGVVLLSYAYFYGGGGWNQDSRIDLVRAIVEEHTLQIDHYQENTGDKGSVQGHYYSDKAPGSAFLATPFFEAGSFIGRLFGLDPRSDHGVLVLSYVSNLFAIAVPSALAAAVLFLFCTNLGFSTGAAAFAAMGMALATPVWAYSTVFFGHVLAGACLLFAFALTVKLRDGSANEWLIAVSIGLLAGWATVTEYPAAPASCIVALLALSQVWYAGRSRRWKVVLGITAGALANILMLAWYQHAAFGSFFSVGYSHYEAGAFPEMTVGFHGLTYPHLSVLLRLLAAPHLGLIWLAPILLFAAVGLWVLSKHPHSRSCALAAAAIALYYWLFNASFSGWDGGWAYGPRYMVPAIPILCIGIAALWSVPSKYLRASMCVLAGYGIACSLLAVSTTAMTPERYRWPLTQLYWPLFRAGKLAISYESLFLPPKPVDPRHAAFNLGQVLGLHGLASLVPLIVVWVAAAMLWTKLNRSAIAMRKPPLSSSRWGTEKKEAASS
jgi:hypothetical protein